MTAIHMHFFCEIIFAKKLTRETNDSDSVQKRSCHKNGSFNHNTFWKHEKMQLRLHMT